MKLIYFKFAVQKQRIVKTIQDFLLLYYKRFAIKTSILTIFSFIHCQCQIILYSYLQEIN